ncbi:hypothetical protein LZZ90_03410 [Flavobacterium sp. SM15]|nr:hypothetical protein [Flavobacterium sp. SM15]
MYLFDVIGKEVFSVDSLEEFNKKGLTLKSGVYFLNAVFAYSTAATIKLIKS